MGVGTKRCNLKTAHLCQRELCLLKNVAMET